MRKTTHGGNTYQCVPYLTIYTKHVLWSDMEWSGLVRLYLTTYVANRNLVNFNYQTASLTQPQVAYQQKNFNYQNASFKHVHRRVGQDFLLNNAHCKLTENASGTSLYFNLEKKNRFLNFQKIIIFNCL